MQHRLQCAGVSADAPDSIGAPRAGRHMGPVRRIDRNRLVE
jgi:hypothetical protein